MRLLTNWAPEQVITLATVVAAAMLGSALWASTQIPSLGIDWRAGDNALVIDQLRADARLTGLQPGQRVTSISSGSGVRLDLTPEDLTPEPDMGFQYYSDMDAFFARQSARLALLENDTVYLHTDSGVVKVQTTPSRSVWSLPFVFWFQLFCAISGLLAGASVWAYRRQDPATKYFALTGFALMCSSGAAAIYSTRELVIDGTLFKYLSALNEFGALLFCGGLIAVLWYYPTRLSTFPAGPLIVMLYAGFAIAIPLRLHDSVELLAYWPIFLGYFSTYGLAFAQWRNTRNDPLQRAALRWFLLSWLFGSGAFLAAVYLPVMLGYNSGAMQGYAFGFFVLIYIGVAIGVLRYQLFRLDRWWFYAWAIFLGGLVVIGLDLLFIYILQLNTHASLFAAMLLAGWLYFPLRQWLWSRLVSGDRQRGHRPALVRMVTEVLSQPEHEPNTAWRALLQQAFAPNAVQPQSAVAQDAIREGGLALDIAGSPHLSPQRLLHCQGGARLFSKSDLDMLSDLRALFAEMLSYRERLDQAVSDERDRVARDLHDDVGARLLTLSHSTQGHGAEQARQALAELRAVVYSMRAPPVQIVELLGDWRAEAADRCEAADVALDWHVYGEPPPLALAGGPALGLSRVMRETISNALHHGNGHRITFNLDFTGSRMFASVYNQYLGGDPAEWRESLGLNNLRDRLTRLGGEIEWQASGGQLQCRWSVDLAGAQAPATVATQV